MSDIALRTYGQKGRDGAGYKGTGRTRLWMRMIVTAAVGTALGLTCAGCSMSYQLDNIFAKADKADTETTGSINAAKSDKPEMPPEGDLVLARRAASEALGRGGKDISVPWENPQSGARGMVTPLGADYRSAGLVCRDFLASFVSPNRESWMQGEACRTEGVKSAKWEVRSFKPWRRT